MRHGITYPVAQGNAYASWKAFDEGRYDEIEGAIGTLVARGVQ